MFREDVWMWLFSLAFGVLGYFMHNWASRVEKSIRGMEVKLGEMHERITRDMGAYTLREPHQEVHGYMEKRLDDHSHRIRKLEQQERPHRTYS